MQSNDKDISSRWYEQFISHTDYRPLERASGNIELGRKQIDLSIDYFCRPNYSPCCLYNAA